jgi:hypothetical protein
MQLFYSLPNYRDKGLSLSRKEAVQNGTKNENHSQAYGLGFTIFLPLIEIVVSIQKGWILAQGKAAAIFQPSRWLSGSSTRIPLSAGFRGLKKRENVALVQRMPFLD